MLIVKETSNASSVVVKNINNQKDSSPKLNINVGLGVPALTFQIKFLGEKLSEKEIDYQSKKIELAKMKDRTKNALRSIGQVNKESLHVNQDNIELERQLNLLLQVNILN